MNKKSTTTEPPPFNGQQPKPPGGLNAFYWYQIFALDSAVVEVQEVLKLAPTKTRLLVSLRNSSYSALKVISK